LVQQLPVCRTCSYAYVKSRKLRYSLAQMAPTESAMVKPRSANTTSPGRRVLRIPQCSVRYTLLTRPPQHSETNEITPCGVTPLQCCGAYTQTRCYILSSNFNSLSINNSKRSIMTTTLVPNDSQKQLGMDFVVPLNQARLSNPSISCLTVSSILEKSWR